MIVAVSGPMAAITVATTSVPTSHAMPAITLRAAKLRGGFTRAARTIAARVKPRHARYPSRPSAESQPRPITPPMTTTARAMLSSGRARRASVCAPGTMRVRRMVGHSVTRVPMTASPRQPSTAEAMWASR